MIKIERILCPTELTPASDEALRYAVALAREYGAKLFLCHCDEPGTARAGGEKPEDTARYVRRLFEDGIVQHLGLTVYSKLDWEGCLVEGDDIGQAITREAAARRCDLIVMRSRRRPRAAALLGSTAETVCRTAPCAVLVTHPREREWVGFSTGEVGLGRLLVAHDFSDRSDLALRYGLSLAREYGAELHLLHVLREPEEDSPELAWVPGTAQGLYQAAVGRLQRAVPGESGLRREAKCVVLTGKPYDKVLTYAKENEVDLICMGAEGAGGGAHSLFGSNVDRVLRQASCPVLVARPFRPADDGAQSVSGGE